MLYLFGGIVTFCQAGPYLLAVWGATTWLVLSTHRGMIVGNSSKEIFKLVLDVFYPSLDSLNCALLGSLMIGLSFDKLRPQMKLMVIVFFAGMLLNLVGDLALDMTTSLPSNDPFAYYNGSWVDWILATAFYLFGIGITFFPTSLSPDVEDSDE